PARASCSIADRSWSTSCRRSTASTTSTLRRTTPTSSGYSRVRNRLQRPKALMDFDGRFLAWVALSALIIATPGPDTALIIRNALIGGPRASTMSALGVAVGILAWAAAATLGGAVLRDRASTAFTILKLAGAAYLFYLGARSLLGSPASGELRPRATGAGGEGRSSHLGAWGQGLVSNLLNPKTGAFFVTVMPQFTFPGDPAIRLAL